jgi:hypothetical protein
MLPKHHSVFCMQVMCHGKVKEDDNRLGDAVSVYGVLAVGNRLAERDGPVTKIRHQT